MRHYGPLTRVTNPLVLLHVEGGLALAAAVIFYAHTGGSWLLFAVLLLAPDLSALGYLAGPRVGAVCYNLVHTYLGPAILGGAGLLSGQALLVSLSLIWCAHIGIDRLLGYGLKYPDAFKHTHLTLEAKVATETTAR